MEMVIGKPKEDCFAYQDTECGVLSVITCPIDCKFYKTHKKYDEDRRKAEIRSLT